MSDYFLDSSALLKRYTAEQGTAWIRALVAPRSGNVLFIAEITPVEIISGIQRRQRAAQLSVVRAQNTRRLLDRHASREYKIVALNDAIVTRAKDLVTVHPLRAYDAVQLASALESNALLLAAGSLPLTFVSADVRLLTAAADEGLATDDPNVYP